MFEILSAAGNYPVNLIGWIVALLSVAIVAVWMRYIYR